MSSTAHNNVDRDAAEKLRQIPVAPWVREMLEHYRRTGAYRPQDLRRLLGDPNRAVEIGPNANLSSFLSTQARG